MRDRPEKAWASTKLMTFPGVGSISVAKYVLAARSISLTRRSSALPSQAPVLLDHHRAGQVVDLPVIGLVLAAPVPQCLGVDVQLFGQQAADRFRLRHSVQAHRALLQLRRILSRCQNSVLPRPATERPCRLVFMIKPDSEVSGAAGEPQSFSGISFLCQRSACSENVVVGCIS